MFSRMLDLICEKNRSIMQEWTNSRDVIERVNVKMYIDFRLFTLKPGKRLDNYNTLLIIETQCQKSCTGYMQTVIKYHS